MRKKDEEKGLVESFLGGMPVFGNFFKGLAKTEAFKERFREINEEIEENLREGREKMWGVKTNISIRPLTARINKDTSKIDIGERTKKDTSDIYIGKDYFYVKTANAIKLAVKAPNENVDLAIKHKSLLISTDNFKKEVELPDYFRNIKKKKYKKGILMVELTK